MKTEPIEALRFIYDTILWAKDEDFLNKEFGCHETGSNLETQTTFHACHGCNATGVSKWENNWKVEFTHESDCKYIKLKKLLQQFE